MTECAQCSDNCCYGVPQVADTYYHGQQSQPLAKTVSTGYGSTEREDERTPIFDSITLLYERKRAVATVRTAIEARAGKYQPASFDLPEGQWEKIRGALLHHMFSLLSQEADSVLETVDGDVNSFYHFIGGAIGALETLSNTDINPEATT